MIVPDDVISEVEIPSDLRTLIFPAELTPALEFINSISYDMSNNVIDLQARRSRQEEEPPEVIFVTEKDLEEERREMPFLGNITMREMESLPERMRKVEEKNALMTEFAD